MRAIRAHVLVLCLAATGTAVADETPHWYARTEAGHAVEVPWLGARIGRVVSGEAVAFDLGAGGSFAGRGFVTLTGGLEVRALARSRVSPFARAELGLLSRSMEGSSAVVSFGGGLAVRIGRAWSTRAGLVRSLQSDAGGGPDYVFVGMERRW